MSRSGARWRYWWPTGERQCLKIFGVQLGDLMFFKTVAAFVPSDISQAVDGHSAFFGAWQLVKSRRIFWEQRGV